MVLVALITCSVSSQEHMTFAGISMGLPLQQFDAELLRKGFKPAADSAGCYGDFAGFRDVVVYPMGDAAGVQKVLVMIPFSDNYRTARSNFDGIIHSLIMQYGNCTRSDMSIDDEGDANIMAGYKLSQGLVKCGKYWAFKNGRIDVSVSVSEKNFLTGMSYSDTINLDKAGRKKGGK